MIAETDIPSTPEAFFKAIKTRLMLSALMGDFSYSRALSIGNMIWAQFPAEFPGFTEAVLDRGPRAAFWEIREIAYTELAGGYDLYKAADAALN